MKLKSNKIKAPHKKNSNEDRDRLAGGRSAGRKSQIRLAALENWDFRSRQPVSPLMKLSTYASRALVIYPIGNNTPLTKIMLRVSYERTCVRAGRSFRHMVVGVLPVVIISHAADGLRHRIIMSIPMSGSRLRPALFMFGKKSNVRPLQRGRLRRIAAARRRSKR